ncbi:hypothetical protein [Amphritea atlantica]|uniref:hypothetical protein n=1 Tax=Amphritea atlantica TaxID=355243 RepID=UPI0021C2C16D|nr:hypothetical protein [Amphritea atlantica]
MDRMARSIPFPHQVRGIDAVVDHVFSDATADENLGLIYKVRILMHIKPSLGRWP